MTTVQKFIKYMATAFAAFLIITIISAILSGIYALLSAFGLIHTHKNIITTDLNLVSSDIKEISSLQLDLAFTDLKIQVGDSFKVETNNSKITLNNNNGSVKIKEEAYNWLGNNSSTSKLVIYIPEDMKILDEAKITTGAGTINIDNLNTKSLDLELGAGEVKINNLTVTENAKIDGGVGKTSFQACEINNLKANLGMGEFVLNGRLTGKSKIDSGVGAISINLTNNKSDYTFDISKGIGNVTIDGQKVETDRVYGTGVNYLEVDGGIGEIKITCPL